MKGYDNALEYLYGLEKFGIVFGLENISWLLRLIGNPETSFASIHVGGTNGKGSVACMVSAILQDAGYRVGRYTSPHLTSFTERITVNGEEIKTDDVVDLTGYIRDKAADTDGSRFFTFFDFTTALAFEYFRRNGTELAVIEVGLGGRLDSTNVINPLATVITNVELDHTDCLGGTVVEIAAEKAGIIKSGVPVITGSRGEAAGVIEEKARQTGSPIFRLGKEFSYEQVREQELSYRGPTREYRNVAVNLKGDHQLGNAALALCAVETVSGNGFPVPDEAIYRAMSTLRWPGRLEVVRDRPMVILDAAHNPHGIGSLVDYLDGHLRGRRKIVVFGVMKDKDYCRMAEELRTRADVLIMTRPETGRALASEGLASLAGAGLVTRDVRTALMEARRLAGEDDVIVVTGSFYTVGEARALVDEIF